MKSVDPIERNFMLRVFRKLCPRELYEGIEGDLIEKYEEEVRTLGERRARTRFVFHTLKFIRPGILLRNKFSIRLINLIMLSNYFTIAWRNLLKNKTFSTINITRLAFELAAC